MFARLQLQPIRRCLFQLLLLVLPALLISLNTAQVRSTVLYALADSGLRRIYETEAPHIHPSDVEVTHPGLMLEPVNDPVLAPSPWTPHQDVPPPSGGRRREGPRGPPHGARAPPHLA